MRKKLNPYALAVIMGVSLVMTGCGNTSTDSTTSTSTAEETTEETEDTEEANESEETEDDSEEETGEVTYTKLTKDDLTLENTIEATEDDEHAIEVDGTEESYSNTEVIKTGDSDDGDEADFYGYNSAIFATNGATLDLTGMYINTNGQHANAVFSYGEGTTVNISDSVIETTGNTSGGLMTTGGGTMNATNVTVHTTGNSSAAIRSDRGGGDVNVTGGYFVTDGVGSPVIYSTADITVDGAYLESTASQGVVVEGANSVTLNDVTLVADNTTKNGDNSDYYQAVMIYQSMSGDADSGESSFTMSGGSLTNNTGDIFFVTNTVATIDLNDVDITNNDADGIFLRASAAGWGTDGSNGGQVTLTAADQEIDGDIYVDSVSTLNFYLTDDSTYTGAINSDGEEGEVYVEIEDGSVWVLTGDSYITALTCGADAIDLNGYTLYIDGVAYEEGSESTGEAIEAATTSTGSSDSGMPSGEAPSGEAPSGEAPERPDEDSSDGSAPSFDGETPPDKPDGE